MFKIKTMSRSRHVRRAKIKYKQTFSISNVYLLRTSVGFRILQLCIWVSHVKWCTRVKQLFVLRCRGVGTECRLRGLSLIIGLIEVVALIAVLEIFLILIISKVWEIVIWAITLMKIREILSIVSLRDFLIIRSRHKSSGCVEYLNWCKGLRLSEFPCSGIGHGVHQVL